MNLKISKKYAVSESTAGSRNTIIPKINNLPRFSFPETLSSSPKLSNVTNTYTTKPPKVPHVKIQTKLQQREQAPESITLNQDYFLFTEYTRTEIPLSRQSHNSQYPYLFLGPNDESDWLHTAIRNAAAYKSVNEFMPEIPDRRQLLSWISEKRNQADFAKYLK